VAGGEGEGDGGVLGGGVDEGGGVGGKWGVDEGVGLGGLSVSDPADNTIRIDRVGG
jgi:hypothetical protein